MYIEEKTYEIKLTEKELIRYYANKIVEDGLDDTQQFSRCVYFFEYKQKDFIEKHKKEILHFINLDERVADVHIDDDCFDMVFYLDYCPYYYEDDIANSLNRKEEIKIFRNFIKYIQRQEKIKGKDNFYTSTRVLTDEFLNTLKKDDHDAFLNRVKQIVWESGFINHNTYKYEVMINYKNVRELKFLINEHIEELIEQEENEESR